MDKYLLYPVGFDPMVAAGPPTKGLIRMGIIWTEEETLLAQEMEKRAEIVEVGSKNQLPRNRWAMKVD